MLNEIIVLLEKYSDKEQAEKMSSYMQNKFKFAGIQRPVLKELIKPYLSKSAKEQLNWDFIFDLWNVDYREAQYIALEYLQKHHKQLQPSDINNLKKLITTKSWWETVDTIDAYVGEIVLKDEALKETMLEWAVDENMWLRRTSIDFQQKYKEKTDWEILEKVIAANLNSKEFFINKAIGWSLRDYSKTNPDWVRDFVDKYQGGLAPLSIKEATKLL